MHPKLTLVGFLVPIRNIQRSTTKDSRAVGIALLGDRLAGHIMVVASCSEKVSH
jgi:hypothetical protein